MSRSQTFEGRKKVSIRVNEPLYEAFKDKVAICTQNKHGMSDVIELFMKAFTKSDIPEQVAREGTPSQERINEDSKATTSKTESIGEKLNRLADVIEKFADSVMKVLPQQQEQEEPEVQVVVDQQGLHGKNRD